MKALLFSTREITVLLGEPSSRPHGTEGLGRSGGGILYSDVVVAFVCVVTDDTERDISTVATAIADYSHMVGKQVLLVPFSHLDSRPAEKQRAMVDLEEVAERLRALGLLAGEGSFGFQNAIIGKWITIAHRGGVAFRDSRHSTVGDNTCGD